MKSRKWTLKLLVCQMCASAVLALTGCQGGSGETATTQPSGAAGTDTNSATTNAPAATNASSSADSSTASSATQ